MAEKKRLIDAGKMRGDWLENGENEYVYDTNAVLESIDAQPTVDAIPISVMKRAIAGINAADQCDQAGRYDFKLRDALRIVLEWYGSPTYKECERRTDHG